jgi:hypothetical protein
MSTNCILNSNDLFSELTKLNLETRRYLLGKYVTTPIYETDFTKITPIHKGEKKCHLKFNFTTDGPRCFWCNTICLLTDDGEIVEKQDIKIRSGSYKGQVITIIKHPIPEINFGSYKPINANHNSHLNTIRRTISRQRMINCSDDSSHDIAISSLINSDSILPFKSRTLGAWLCDDVNVLKLVPTLGNFNNAIFTSEIMKSTFFQLFVLSGTESFSHGAPSGDNLWLSNFPTVFPVDKERKIKMTSMLFIDPSIYSSYTVEYQDRRLYFVGKHSDSEREEPNWNINFKLINDKSYCENLTKSPCMKSYLRERISTILPSMDLMNYIRYTGINVFPQFYFFIYITIALLNKSFYDNFIISGACKIFQKVFLDNDYTSYMNVINKNIGSIKNSDQIIELLVESNIRIRHDVITIIKNDILNFMLT